MEKAEVDTLLDLARATEAQGTDAKAEALLELIYKLQQEESDPELKVLVFTEFVPTQAMLADFLESRGFSVVTLNGSMDLEARTRAQQSFSRDIRILISTDAGGEGLNLQFCHVIVNFDMPWNPMRVEQRIGRVDRIGQPHVVRAINFVLEDTVEHRVREVLETKLAIIAEEFGVDKAADVMDSVEAEPLFDELFVQGLQNPDAIESECDAVVSQLRSTIAESKKSSELLSDEHQLDADDARKWRDHPAQFWLERAITTGLPARGGNAVKEADVWRVRWVDGSVSAKVCFDARTAEERPDVEWVTLEDPRARAVISDLPRCVSGQPLPTVRIAGLPESVRGVWSLWEISLSADDFSRRRFLSVFVNDEGRTFLPTAKRIWDLLLTERVESVGAVAAADANGCFDRSKNAALAQGERIFAELVAEHGARIKEERERAKYAYDVRHQAIGRVGLQTVRGYRRKRLRADHDTRMAQLDAAEAYTPDLNAVLLLRVGGPGPDTS
ncbi:helicase-related protein [Mesorhizobium sp. YM1C-6-2]|uniref:helicase-related protein n=1 Tax=Mesorhizobium sp. YM1C-6-2 TaxID=1827501 RepID=UPI001600BA57|nr:helicase-related protein [Mesorhizobium sp. YM1C-6-2]